MIKKFPRKGHFAPLGPNFNHPFAYRLINTDLPILPDQKSKINNRHSFISPHFLRPPRI